jgi:micrococcal nuclease
MARRRPPRRPAAAGDPFAFFRRRSTLWLLAALATLALGAGLAALSGSGGENDDPAPTATAVLTPATAEAPPTATAAVAAPGLAPDPARLEAATVLRVVDGDTIDVRLPGGEERVRYFGVDTPERGEACFGAATERNRQLVGERVLLLPDARERDRFGRLLRYVFDEEGRSVDALLIAEGLGFAWREDGAYRDELIALEARAEAANAGCLWE